MAGFAESYLGRLRAVVGQRLILMPGARVVVVDATGRLLLQLRTDFNLWGLPSGSPEVGENLTNSLVRELEEETGLRTSSPVPFGFASDPEFETITFPNGDRCQYFSMLFAVSVFDGAPVVSDDESHAVGWFFWNELPAMIPNMRRTVDAYLRYRDTGDFQMI